MKKLLLLLLTLSHNAFAGIPVTDASNLVQNILSAARALESNINEAKMVANQVESLANEAKNLTSLRFDIIQDFNSQFSELFETLGTINGLMQNLSTLQSNFEQLYPDYSYQYRKVPSALVAADVQGWISETRSMVLGSAKTGAQVLENMPQTEAQLQELMASSQGALGILQATQAGNQIAATISGNLINLNSQLASYTQAHTAYLMEVTSSAATVKQQNDHVLDDWAKPYSGQPIAENPF